MEKQTHKEVKVVQQQKQVHKDVKQSKEVKQEKQIHKEVKQPQQLKQGKQVHKEVKEVKQVKDKQHTVETIKTKFEIVGKKKINHDCYIYDLKWAGPKFNLGIGQHFRINETIPTWEHPQGELVVRKYTPISPCNKNQELIQLLIKIYRPNSNPKFPQGGKMTPYLQKLQVGATINVEGPFGKFAYKPGGVVVLDGVEHKAKRLFFVAGGSGITPCYQTITEIIAMKDQTVQLILLFANKSEADIVLRQELESLQPRLRLIYIIDVCPPDWKYIGGHVTKEIFESILPLDDPETIYIHCGPPGMNQMIRQMFGKFYPKSITFKY